MQFNRTLLETGDIHPLFVQQDANTDITGDWMSMVNYNRSYVLMHKAGSEDVDTLGLQIIQASDNAATGAKAVLVGRCWYKTGTMTAQGLWTAVNFSSGADFLGFGSALSGGVTYATTSNQRVVADVDTAPISLLVEILNTDIDQANGFKYITAHLEGDNVDNSCLITAFWLGFMPFYAAALPPDPTL